MKPFKFLTLSLFYFFASSSKSWSTVAQIWTHDARLTGGPRYTLPPCSARWTSHRCQFINILLPAFTLTDPKSVKKIENLTVFFMLLGSALIKAVHRTLMKLSPGVNFFNILLTPFFQKSVFLPFFSIYSRLFSLVTVWLCNFLQNNIGAKTARKMLMILTKGPSRGWSSSLGQRHCRRDSRGRSQEIPAPCTGWYFA